MQEEIFGPVLAIAKAKDWKEAIAMYNDTEFGLTGSYFSTDEDRIAEALETVHCGNLYIISQMHRRIWWVYIPLAASICRERIPKQAVTTDLMLLTERPS